ncbi:MAG: ABC transporter ATP-binding protein [Atopobium sp.]|jgi:energy-coupling factor transport system ATP-binding protein|nr:energy-coupling factor ABC transporter ATP-binding protein [Atopobiaceae bacterium]NLH91073.1 ABC transporter ATP-binding protein [Atopobium sp.]
MNKIEVQNLHFSYTANTEVLKGLNFTLDERSTAIVGQNGAGKTTFVKLLKGLLQPTSGQILFNDRNIKDISVPALAKYIGLVFQNPNDQIFKNTVLDEVMFGPLQIGMSTEKAKIASQEALGIVGLEDKEEVNPYDLGLSDRKMVSIAAILAMHTDVVIFDEPTIAQDYDGKMRLRQIIKKLTAEHKVVISILHDMDFVAQTFERVIVLAYGQVLLDSDPRSVFSKREILQNAYLEQPTTTQLCHALGYDDVFLSPSEFVNRYRTITDKSAAKD